MAKVKKLHVTLYRIDGTEEGKEVKITKAVTRNYRRLFGIVSRISARITNEADESMLEALNVVLYGQVPGGIFDEEGNLRSDVEFELNKGQTRAILFAIENFSEEVWEIISALTNLNHEDIDSLDEEDLFKVLNAVIEVNDPKKLYGLVTKFLENLKVILPANEVEKTDKATEADKTEENSN